MPFMPFLGQKAESRVCKFSLIKCETKLHYTITDFINIGSNKPQNKETNSKTETNQTLNITKNLIKQLCFKPGHKKNKRHGCELTRQFPELQNQWALNSGTALELWRWSLPLPHCRTGCPLCFCSCCNVWQYMTHPLVCQNPARVKYSTVVALVLLKEKSMVYMYSRKPQLLCSMQLSIFTN